MPKRPRYTVTLDDDPAVFRIIERCMGTPSKHFSSLEELLPQVSHLHPMAAFLDINLGSSRSGLEIIPHLRKQWPFCPLFVITSDTSEQAISEAVGAGADDFIVKPIRKEELLARLKARLVDKADIKSKAVLRIGEVSFDLTHRRLSANGKEAYLSPTATNLLRTLAETKGTTCDHLFLKRRVWGNFALSDNALDRKIYELRKALEAVSSRVTVKNIYGSGFVIDAGNQDTRKETKTEKAEAAPKLPSTVARISEKTELTESERTRVLLIEDADSDAVLVREALRSVGNGISYDLKRAATLADGLEALAKGNVDVVLLDLHLPDSSGLDTFINLHNEYPVPVVVLSGMIDERLAAQAVLLGAQDFLSKNEVRASSLSKTIRYAQARFKLGLIEKSELRSQKEHADKLANLKSQFMANMSHEIRSPMNGVIGMTSLLSQTELSAEQSEYVTTIRKSGEALLCVIDEILDYSKLEAGEVRLESLEFDPRTLIEDVIRLFSASACERKLSLIDTIDPSIPQVIKGDPNRLRQILINLVGNAMKFTHAGKVTIKASPTHGKNGRISFAISDTGVGIAEGAKGNLFEMFQQEDMSITRKYGGTGLGLAISKRLIGLMGGKIDFSSKKGQGTTFFFDLPFEVPKKPAFLPRPDLQGKTVLILDEKSELGSDLREQLKMRGLRVTEADSQYSAGTHPNVDAVIVVASETSSLEESGLSTRLQEFRSWKLPILCLVPKTAREIAEDDAYFRTIRTPVVQSEFYRAIAEMLVPEEKSRNAAKVMATTAQPNISKPLLIAEDNPVNQKVAMRMIQKLGLHADLVGDGAEAVAAVDKTAYAAILMDCSMPNMDGYEATKLIRQKGFQCPIIALTANAFQEDRDRCLQSGMDDFMSKPIQIDQLREMLMKYQNRTDAGAATPPKSMLNPKTLADLRALSDPDEGDFLGELIELFLANAPGVLDEINKSIQQKEGDRMKRQAHRLKGFAANLGAQSMVDLCAEFENLGEKKDTAKGQELFPTLTTQFQQLVEELKKEKDKTV